jgi:hypothetical protein
MFVYFKSFVMNVVSLPVYVNVAHFYLVRCFSGCDGGGFRVSGGLSDRSCCVGCFG